MRRKNDPEDRRRIIVEPVLNKKLERKLEMIFVPLHEKMYNLLSSHSDSELNFRFETLTKITEDIQKTVDMGDSLPPDKIVGGLKHITVLKGKENEFESLFRELVLEVRKHDKGCNYYDLYKSDQPRTYLVMEQYENRDALQEHQKSEHGERYFPKFREILENIDVNYFVCTRRLKSV